MSSSSPPSPPSPAMHVNHAKLHPIYSALESSQHGKAVKLCLQQPDNLMAVALLAHAYVKLGQRSAAVLVLGRILPEWLPELQMEIQQVMVLERQRPEPPGNDNPRHAASTTSSSAPAVSSKSSKAGMKGKKAAKPASASASSSSAGSSVAKNANASNGTEGGGPLQDGIDRLDDPPRVPLDWDQRAPPPPPPPPLSSSVSSSSHDPHHRDRLLASDETLLTTVAMLTKSSLGMPLTCFQLLSWAAAAAATAATASGSAPSPSGAPSSEKLWRDAYCAGFHVLVSPRYEHIADAVLTHMQGIAMRLAKQHPAHHSTAWAAQTALWQWQQHHEQQQQQQNASDTNGVATTAEEAAPSKANLFLRLAVSLAFKALEHPVTTGASTALVPASAGTGDRTPPPSTTLVQCETFLLYLRALQLSGQHEKVLEAVDGRLAQADARGGDSDAGGDGNSSNLVQPPRQVLLEHKANALIHLERFGPARLLIETELLRLYPDDWSCWKRHLRCSMEESGPDEGIGKTEAFIAAVLDRFENGGATEYPLRGPLLMKVEVAAERLRRSVTATVDDLVETIVAYGSKFAPHAACTFTDLLPYVDRVLRCDAAEKKSDAASSLSPPRGKLLDWLRGLGGAPSSTDAKERRKELRVYIFATQLTFRLVAGSASYVRNMWITPWVDVLRVWKSFQEYDQVNDENMKENRPADELVLLAAQQLILGDRDDPSSASDAMTLQTAASVLEAAMEYSPHNPHLKIAALFVYSEMNAASRSWSLFQDLYVKHIQYESLSYLILPVLWSGGMYVEAVCVCKDILRLQRTAAYDTGEYTGRAMESGALSKAEEFVRFHRDRMNRSLTCLEAKGYILLGAPLYVQDDKQPSFGAMQGIVGGPDDSSRAYEILANVTDPFSAFSVLQLGTRTSHVVDNRDFDVLSNDLLNPRTFASVEQVVNATTRRGHVQGLLIRSSLVKDLTKGPKKGKVVPTSDALRHRCRSLLSYINVAREFGEVTAETHHPNNLLFMKVLIIECQVLSVVSSGLVADSNKEATALQEREAIACSLLDQIRQVLDSTPPTDLCVASVSQMLPECILPAFAAFSMCSEIFDVFGWGKRKSKKCAEGLALVAQSLHNIIRKMESCLDCLSRQAAESNPHRKFIVPELVTEEAYSQTAYSIAQSQMITKDRICRVLFDIQVSLQSFNVQG